MKLTADSKTPTIMVWLLSGPDKAGEVYVGGLETLHQNPFVCAGNQEPWFGKRGTFAMEIEAYTLKDWEEEAGGGSREEVRVGCCDEDSWGPGLNLCLD